MKYESNAKHSEPWQRGRRGSLCPKEVKPLAADLLAQSVLHGSKRYATHGGKAYCAQQSVADVWHGYPVAWREVPPDVVQAWTSKDIALRRVVRRARRRSRR